MIARIEGQSTQLTHNRVPVGTLTATTQVIESAATGAGRTTLPTLVATRPPLRWTG